MPGRSVSIAITSAHALIYLLKIMNSTIAVIRRFVSVCAQRGTIKWHLYTLKYFVLKHHTVDCGCAMTATLQSNRVNKDALRIEPNKSQSSVHCFSIFRVIRCNTSNRLLYRVFLWLWFGIILCISKIQCTHFKQTASSFAVCIRLAASLCARDEPLLNIDVKKYADLL